MKIRSFRRPKLTWWRLVLSVVGLALVGAAVYWGRSVLVPKAEAALPPSARETPAPVAVISEPSDYTRRPVAFLYGTTQITREQLGEYLIARYGADKIQLLVNKRIIEKTCTEKGIGVTEAEISAQLAEDLGPIKSNQKEFVDSFLQQRHMSLYEWREDVLRPKILMTKLLRNEVQVNEEEIRKAFQSLYGERVQCQAIMWPKEKVETAHGAYEKILQDPEEFDRLARTQYNRRLAAVGGMLEPFGCGGMGDVEVARRIFQLKEGEITPVFQTKTTDGECCAIFKLIHRIEPQKTVKLEEVRGIVEKEVLDRKIQVLITPRCKKLYDDANPEIHTAELAKDPEATGRSREVVAIIYGNIPITREELGEFLIERYGKEKIDLFVNKLIIEKVCAARGIQVADAEVEAELNQYLTQANVTKEAFVKNVLSPHHVTMYEWKEDNLRAELMMRKLIHDTVRVENDDLRKCFEAHYGEKVECQLILWPLTRGEHEIAIRQYDQIRQSAEAFDRVARTQASSRLAAAGGHMDPPSFGRWSTGNEIVEREVFKLHEGEITPIIETPEGYAVFKLLKRIPPVANKKLEDVRAELEKEILDKKTKLQIRPEFPEASRCRRAQHPLGRAAARGGSDQ